MEQPTTRDLKRRRHLAIVELIGAQAVGSQPELVALLGERGFEVTQATVSRDITELGLVKAPRGDGHAYTTPADLVRAVDTDDERLRRILRDLPVTVGRSGLILLLISTPGTAGVIAEAIDRSSLREQEGTIAGDNTVLVLFSDEAKLERWRAQLDRMQHDVSAEPGVR